MIPSRQAVQQFDKQLCEDECIKPIGFNEAAVRRLADQVPADSHVVWLLMPQTLLSWSRPSVKGMKLTFKECMISADHADIIDPYDQLPLLKQY